MCEILSISGISGYSKQREKERIKQILKVSTVDVQIKRYKGYLAQKFSSLNNPFNLIDVNKKIKKKKEEKRNFCLFWYLECNARKVICSCVYSVYILKPVLSGRNWWTRKDASVFFYYPRRLKALNFDNFDNSHNSFLWPEYYRPLTVHCSTKDANTSEITFLALNPWISWSN